MDQNLLALPLASPAVGRKALLPVEVNLWCVRAFAASAVTGALVALIAPLALMRVFGLIAMVAGALGVALHVAMLRRDHAWSWNEQRAQWRSRLAQVRRSIERRVSNRMLAHGPARAQGL